MQGDLFAGPVDAVIERLAERWRAESKLAFEHLRRSFGQTTRFDHFARRYMNHNQETL